MIVRAIEIEPGKESTFDEVKDQVRDKLAKQRALGHMQERFDLVEEGRNAGKTLKEIGDEQKLRFIDVEATDKTNKTPDGKTAVDYPDATIILKEAFQREPGPRQRSRSSCRAIPSHGSTSSRSPSRSRSRSKT